MKFYPAMPIDGMNRLPEALKVLGHPVERGRDIFWSYRTTSEPVEVKLNAGCHDVSKTRVNLIHEAAMGYDIGVDPQTYEGRYVEKSDLQAVRIGRVLNDNIDPVEGMVYQKFIDTSINEKEFIELRVFYCLGELFTIAKYRLKSDVFGYRAHHSEVVQPFTKQEKENIVKFCELFGMDFGELDILHNKRPYVIDVNNVAGVGLLNETTYPMYYEQVEKLVEWLSE